MKDRIKLLRKELKLNQTDFGERIGVKQASVAGYEAGIRTPLDAVITSICREFNVNEDWLRTGNGEMFLPMTRSDELAKMTTDLFKGEESSFKSRLILALSKLDENEWAVLEKIAKELENGLKKKD
ncbi:MAG: transcriptional regulator [Blautia sp. CAG:37_48_57]|jgi:transcriptional regulator with XRE-family HTH domain|nr:MAG: transcriptional regulator [Blautia sp. CAG:37_48_57]DAG72714.1 MAG TPA: Repressor protein CI [Caudoviricetes sp.]